MPSRMGAVHVATTTRKYKGKVYQTTLLRRTYRQDGKVKHQTLGNISHLPPNLIDIIRRGLRGELGDPGAGWDIVRSLPHGHVAAVLGTLQNIGLDRVLLTRRCRPRDIICALIVSRIIEPASKLATTRFLKTETATTSLPVELGLDGLRQGEVYEAMDWLLQRQRRIENKLARTHLAEGVLVLYDVSGSYCTGRWGGVVRFGHHRDGKRGVPQIVYGLLCNGEGCPVSVEVFDGDTSDPMTFTRQVEKIRKRFGIERVVFVGDRGMITSARIEEDLRPVEGLDWITALRCAGIRKLASEGVVNPSLFDQRDLAEVTSPDYPGERLIVCRNPLLAVERSRKRDELLAATEQKLDAIVEATRRPRRPLKGAAGIGVRVGRVLNQYKVGKHFGLHIGEDHFRYHRHEEKIKQEAALDGLYVIRTSVPTPSMSSESAVRAYKSLSRVERAFRCLETLDLPIRPIHHRLDDRIGAHVFLCMLAYYVEWHMRSKLAPILFDDHEKGQAEGQRQSIVAPAPRSGAAQKKDRSKRTEDDYPGHSFRSVLQDLGTLAKNRVRIRESGDEFYLNTTPTPGQAHALQLLGVGLTA
ncbi:MAG: IS1634 family transposase [Planctomycetes bacterium]|nr:IS1634 family transposase [Planctomycetota bacterium]